MVQNSLIQNIPDMIANQLREEILNNVIKAGTALKQQEVGKRFDVSMIPVREAFRKLEAEGLVVVFPNRGAFVSEISIEEIKEIFETRIILEIGAFEKAMEYITEIHIQEAASINLQLDKAVTPRDKSYYNEKFHAALFKPIQNEYLVNLIGVLHRNIERYMRYYLNDQIHHDQSQKYHRDILMAIQEGDSKKAKQYLEEHMREALNSLTKCMIAAGAR